MHPMALSAFGPHAVLTDVSNTKVSTRQRGRNENRWKHSFWIYKQSNVGQLCYQIYEYGKQSIYVDTEDASLQIVFLGYAISYLLSSFRLSIIIAVFVVCHYSLYSDMSWSIIEWCIFFIL